MNFVRIRIINHIRFLQHIDNLFVSQSLGEILVKFTRKHIKIAHKKFKIETNVCMGPCIDTITLPDMLGLLQFINETYYDEHEILLQSNLFIDIYTTHYNNRTWVYYRLCEPITVRQTLPLC